MLKNKILFIFKMVFLEKKIKLVYKISKEIYTFK